MSYIIKTPPNHQQTSDAQKAAADTQKFNDLYNRLENEVNTRAANFLDLTNKINIESATRTAETAALYNALTAETDTRAAQVATLTNNLNNEIQARTNNFDDLTNQLNFETSTRKTETADLYSKLNTEINLRSQENHDLNSKLDTEIENSSNFNNAIQSQLNQEIENRSQADISIHTKINNEIQARTDNFNALDNKIDTEISNRVSDTTLLRGELQSAITLEEMARNNDIGDLRTALTNTINSNKTAQDAVNQALRDEIALAAEGQSGTSTALSTRLDNEISQRQNDTATLTNKINAETSNRVAAINSLDTTLKNYADTQVSSGLTVAKSYTDEKVASNLTVAKTYTDNQVSSNLTAAKNYTDEKFSAVNINDFTAPTASAAGQRGLVPAPPKGTDMKILTSKGWRTAADSTLTVSTLPTQNGALTFNNANQSPTWLNFDSNKLSISGTTSAKNAGTYTVTFTPLDLYVWSDTQNQSPKTQTWQIVPRTLNKPAASVTEFDFDGNTKTLAVTNFDSNYMNQTGAYSASAAGNYSVTYSLKDKTNTSWSDSTTGDVVLSWRIVKRVFNKPTAAITEFNYDGTQKTLTVANFDANYMNRTGTISATNTGDYSVVFSLKNKNSSTWTDGTTSDITINWKIKLSNLTPGQSDGFAQVGTLTYNGQNQSVTIQNYDSSIHKLSGTTEASNAGTYTAYIEPVDGVKWYDDTSARKSISWTIEKLYLPNPYLQTPSITYDRQAHTPTIKNYNSNYMTLTSGYPKARTDIGSDSFKIWVNNSSSSCFDDGNTEVTLTFTVNTAYVAKPTGSPLKITYDGKAHIPTFTYDPLLTVEDTTTAQIHAGEYVTSFVACRTTDVPYGNVFIESDDGNTAYIWWTIEPKKIVKPTLKVNSFDYDGTEKTVQILGFDSNTMVIGEGDLGILSATEPGVYVISVGLKWVEDFPANHLNYCWSDGDENDYVELSWAIVQNEIPAEYSSGFEQIEPLTFNKSAQSANIRNYHSGYHKLTGTTSATAAGTYTCYIEPKDGKTWADGSTTKFEITWTIEKRKFPKPYLAQNKFTYSGITISVTVNNFESDYMTASGDTSATNSSSANYLVTVRLNDKTNTAWADDSTETVPLVWRINPADASDVELSITKVLTYDGTAKTISANDINNFDATYHKISADSTLSATNVGEYKVYIELQPGYCWKDGTTARKELTWTINKLMLRKPSAGPRGVFNGQVQRAYALYRDVNYERLIYIDEPGSLPGTYRYEIELIDKVNTCWADESTENLSQSWEIISKMLSREESDYSTVIEYVFTGEEITLEELPQRPTQWTTISGTLTASDCGTYTATITAIEGVRFHNLFGSGRTQTQTWKIIPAEMPYDNSNYIYPAVEYTRSEINLADYIGGYDPKYHVLTGELTATNVYESGAREAVPTQRKAYITPTANYCWQGGGQETQTITWWIDPKRIKEPEFEANGGELVNGVLTYEWNDGELTGPNMTEQSLYDMYGTRMYYEYIAPFVYNQDPFASGTPQYNRARGVGNYTVSFGLRDTLNFTWQNHKATDAIILYFNVVPKKIPLPHFVGDTTLTYTGEYRGPVLQDYDTKYHEPINHPDYPKLNLTHHVGKAIEAGQYCIGFDLKDPFNTVWNSGLAAIDTVWLYWEIVVAQVRNSAPGELSNLELRLAIEDLQRAVADLYVSQNVSKP